MNTSIYIKSVSDSEYSNEGFGYPGKVTSYMDGKIIEESRMFFGECLEVGEPTIIFYTHYLGIDGKWQKDVYDVDFNKNQIARNLAPIPYESISETERFVENGLCREVWGIDRASEP